MSGGAFDYAYFKLIDMANPGDMKIKVGKAIEVISELMHDVEWVESGDSCWDTEMAAEWWERVYNLCCDMIDEEHGGDKRPPTAPAHYPHGKAMCQFCGAGKDHWNAAFVFKPEVNSD